MDTSIETITIAQQADLAARTAWQTQERQTNPHPAGSPEALEWDRRFQIALLRYGAPEECEGGA